MKTETLYKSLRLPNEPGTKLVLLVLDGIGDIATSGTRFLTPLEAAKTPNFDELAKASSLEYEVGRGVIEALGLGIELKSGDVAARANFATLDSKGIVTDRRAGRIATEVNEALCKKLQKIKKVGGAELLRIERVV